MWNQSPKRKLTDSQSCSSISFQGQHTTSQRTEKRKMSCRERSTSPVLHGQPFRVNGTNEQMDKIWMRCWHKCVTLLCVFVLG